MRLLAALALSIGLASTTLPSRAGRDTVASREGARRAASLPGAGKPAGFPFSACPALAPLQIGSGLQVLVGAQPSPPDGTCSAASQVVGHGTRDPSWDAKVGMGPAGQWSPLSSLGAAATGLPFGHRGSAWLLQWPEGDDSGGAGFFAAVPLSGESALSGHRFARAPGAVAHAVARLDDWEFLVVQQLADGALLVLRVAAEGAADEAEIEESYVVAPAWPPGSRLAGAAASGGGWVALGRSDDGAVHVVELRGGLAAQPLAARSDDRVAGTVTSRGVEVVVASADGGLRRHVLRDGGWEPAGEARLGTAPLSVAAGTLGKAHETFVAVVLVEGAIVSWSADHEPERHELALSPAGGLAPPPAPPPPRAWRPFELVLGALGLVLLLVAGVAMLARQRG